MSFAEIESMTIQEQLDTMEKIWSVLSKNQAQIDSPEWHGEILAQRDRLIDSGDEICIDWDTAKKQLREELQ